MDRSIKLTESHAVNVRSECYAVVIYHCTTTTIKRVTVYAYLIMFSKQLFRPPLFSYTHTF